MVERDGLTTGQLRKRTGVTRPQLRYWEAAGIIRPTLEEHYTRTWRLYSQADAETVRRLLWLISEGMTLRGAVAKLPAVEELERRSGNAKAAAPSP